MNQTEEWIEREEYVDAAPEQGRSEAVSVEIYDQVYHLRGTDPQYIQQLATLVDQKMRAVAAQGSTVDSLRVAVLACLNITDELMLLRERNEELAGVASETQTTQESSQQTMRTLAGMLDELLDAELDSVPIRRAG